MRTSAALVCAAVLAGLTAMAAGSSSGAASTPSTRGLQTSLFLSGIGIAGHNLDVSLNWARKSGATAIRLPLDWQQVASSKPSNPGNPSDPGYAWGFVDRIVTETSAFGLQPMLTIYQAPRWAGGNRPSPKQMGLFAKAAARRYNGSFQQLPRVKHWLIWNEPNLHKYFAPQYRHHRIVSAVRYRKILNAASAAIHGVHGDNIVIGGELAPVNTSSSPGAMAFTRAALCVSARYHSTCKTRVNADVWSVHPYSSGGPAHKAFGSGGVAFGDLPRFQKTVHAAVRMHHLHARRKVKVWVTEFSWDSKPPDHLGVPVGLEAKWASYALYKAWAYGIPMLTWFRLVDEPIRRSPYQSGLYYRGKTSYKKSRPKPVLRAFRFPFVAKQHGSRVYVWGRAPDSSRHLVAVQIKRHGWKTVIKLRSNANGIFFKTLHVRGVRKSSSFRAKLLDGNDVSIGFRLNTVLDKYYPAFGS